MFTSNGLLAPMCPAPSFATTTTLLFTTFVPMLGNVIVPLQTPFTKAVLLEGVRTKGFAPEEEALNDTVPLNGINAPTPSRAVIVTLIGRPTVCGEIGR